MNIPGLGTGNMNIEYLADLNFHKYFFEKLSIGYICCKFNTIFYYSIRHSFLLCLIM